MNSRKLPLAGNLMGHTPPAVYAFATIVLELAIIIYWQVQRQLTLENALAPAFGLLFGLAIALTLYLPQIADAVLDRPPSTTVSPPVTNPQPGTEMGFPPSTRQPASTAIGSGPISPPGDGSRTGPRLWPKNRDLPCPGTTAVTKPQGFIFPKEGNDPTHCEDKFKMNYELARYAVADGVARSFLPAEWAEIIVRNFVATQKDFSDKTSIIPWLEKCRDEWKEFAQHWVQDAQEKNPYEDFDRLIRQGAQTTLIGCSLFSQPGGSIGINVLAVGDAHFFLVRQPHTLRWTFERFPYSSPDQFSSRTETLGTSTSRIHNAPEVLRVPQPIIANQGDVIVLTSDELAKWILSQPRENTAAAWNDLFAIDSNEKLRRFVEQRLDDGEMKLDDVTLLIIPLRTASGRELR